MTAPVQPVAPAPEQAPAQPPAPAPAPAEGAPVDQGQVWPPPDEEIIRLQMASRFSIIEEPTGETADGADQDVVAPVGTTPAPGAATAPQAPVAPAQG